VIALKPCRRSQRICPPKSRGATVSLRVIAEAVEDGKPIR
jgi:hypothetical protein